MKINIVVSLIISCLCHNANAQLITFDDNNIGENMPTVRLLVGVLTSTLT
jgi:hypothetical protein